MGRSCMVQVACVLALTMGLVLSIFLIGCSDATSATTSNATAQTTSVNFVVRGMVCENCEAAVTDAMNRLDSVEFSSASFVNGSATAELSDPTTTDAVLASVRELGYEIERLE